MSEKVKVSKEVAEAIEEIKATMNDCGVPLFKVAWEFYNHDGDKKFTVISEFVNGDTDQFIKLMLSEIVVEQTPEEQLIEYFNLLRRTPEEIKKAEIEGDMIPGLSSEQVVVINTLNFLSHKVKGVNC